MSKLRSFSESITTGRRSSFAVQPISKPLTPPPGKKKLKTMREKIRDSRKALIMDLLGQKMTPMDIQFFLISEPQSDWTPQEIKGFLIELGVPKKSLWQEQKGDNYHCSIGWY